MTTPASILDGFDLSPEQRTAALVRGRDVAVTAGAGTGKTRTLVARFLALLEDDLPLRSVVAVTFTRKAAREMRNRVRRDIATYLKQPNHDGATLARWQDIYNDLDAARIGTIHNLCAEILRNHPAEAGIDPRFAVLDETQSSLLQNEVAEAALAWAANWPGAAPLFALRREQEMLALIKTLLTQRQVIEAFVESVPAETIRDHWQQSLAQQQAEEVKRLMARQDWQAAHQTLRSAEPLDRDDRLAAQALEARAVLRDLPAQALPAQLRGLAALAGIQLNAGSGKAWPDGLEQRQEIKGALGTLRQAVKTRPLLALELNGVDDTLAGAMPALYALFRQVATTYANLKAERGALDFDDLEAKAIGLLSAHPDVAEYWHGQVRALLVDEFQDTNDSQRRLVRLLCPAPGKLFIVGDAKQSIYRFRGADVTVFDAERQEIKSQGGRLINLDTSYRAHKALLEGVNRLLHPVLRDPSPERPPWEAPFETLHAGRDHVEDGMAPPFISLQLSCGNKGEALPRAAAILAAELAALHGRGVIDYGEVAILCRSSGAFQTYEDALDAAGIPYVTVAGKGFYQRPEIRDLLNALAAIADPHDDLALVGLLRSPACGLPDETIYRLVRARPAEQSLWQALQGDPLPEDDAAPRLREIVALVAALNQQAGRTTVADILRQFLDRTYYRAILRRAGQPRALRNISKLLLDVYRSEMVSISAFLEYAQTLRDIGSREGEARATSGGAVQIMSIHAAKGLEFPVVILGDAASSSNRSSGVLVDPHLGVLLPCQDANDKKAACYTLADSRNKEQEAAETARLLYVALTRAEQLLLINGNVQTNQAGLAARGWLKELATSLALQDWDLSGLDAGGAKAYSFELDLQGTPVGVALYEAGYDVESPAAPAGIAPAPAETASSTPLLAPLDTAAARDGVAETPPRVWNVVSPRNQQQAPAWVIGQLVHEALAMWRFPGQDFDLWAEARARECGLTDVGQLRDAARSARQLLERFRGEPLFREMAAAERRLHEVPFSYEADGRTRIGYIDALFYHSGRWTLVDFKTDALRRGETPRSLLDRTDYEQQVRRYGAAVRALLGESPRLLICLLQADGGKQVTEVTPQAG